MSEITTYLINVSNADPNIRVPAEKMLEQAKNDNFPQYIALLSQELRDESKPSMSRHLAGIQIKNALTGKSREYIDIARQRWVTLAPEVKSAVRMNCLESLRSANPDVRKVGPQAIAAIALLDLPTGEWSDLLPGLCAAAAKGSESILRISALTTIEYICDEIDSSIVAPSMNDIIKTVVAAAEPAEQDPIVKCAALSAFTTLIDGIEEIFRGEQERNYIMSVLLQGANDQNGNIQSKAIENLGSVSWAYYEYMKPYMDGIFKVTVSRMNQCTAEDNEDDIVIKSIDIWTGIAEKEADIADKREPDETDEEIGLLHIVDAALTSLVPPLTHCLTLQDEEFGAWNVASAASECIAAMALCAKDLIVQPVMAFVNAGITSPDWHQREGALTAFYSIVEGPPSIPINLTSTPALKYIVGLMDDQNECVRAAAAWVVGRICHVHSTVVADPSTLNDIIDKLVAKLADVPRVAVQACSAVESLADISKSVATSPLTLKFTAIAEGLLKAAEMRDGEEYSLSSTAYKALNTLVRHSNKDSAPAVLQLASVVGERLKTLLTSTAAAKAAGSTVDDAAMDELQDSVCGVLNECVQKLGAGIAPNAESVIMLLNGLFASGAGARAKAEAITGIGYLVAAIEDAFLPYAEKIAPGLIFCISCVQEPELCKAALIAIGNIANVPALSGVLQAYMGKIIPTMSAALTAPEIPQDLRPVILSTYGEIALFMGNAFQPFLADLVQVLAQASAVSVNVDDDDQVDYINMLRSSVLETFTSIIQSVDAAMVAPHVRLILDSVYSICNDYEANYDVTLIAIMGVLGDLASRLGKNLMGVIRKDDVTNIQAVCDKIKSDPGIEKDAKTNQLFRWTYIQVKRALY